jgi:hypothetical protein
MFSGQFTIHILGNLRHPLDNIAVPNDSSGWVEKMRAVLESEQLIRMTVASTDQPGVVAIGFSPNAALEGHDLEKEMARGEAFGFYVNVELATEFSKLFGFLANAHTLRHP